MLGVRTRLAIDVVLRPVGGENSAITSRNGKTIPETEN
jgi:hypothetical protein